jgi:polar amino acid transport system substrate-binding protein
MTAGWPRWMKFSLGPCLVGVAVMVPPFFYGMAAAAADLQTIEARGRLIVAVKENLRPLGFRDDAGKLQGFEIDIAQELAAELLGSKEAVVLKPVLNQERLKFVIEGEVDVAIAQVTCTPARARIVALTLPYYIDGLALVTRDPTIQSVAALSTQTVAVLQGSTAIETLRYRFPQVNLLPVDSYAAGRTAVEQGAAIAFAADASVLSGWVQELPQYRLLTPTLSAAPLCIVLAKGRQSDELRRRIDEILRKWKAEGWLRSRAVHWGLP